MTAHVIDGRGVFAGARASAHAEATLCMIAALHEPCLCANDCPFCLSCGHGGDFWPCAERHLVDECVGEQRVSDAIGAMHGVTEGAKVYLLQDLLR